MNASNGHTPAVPRLPGWLRGMIGAMMREYDGQLAGLKEQLEGYEETRDRLRILQHVLICLLEQQGGSVVLYAGQLNEVAAGSVVGVQKLAAGEGDRVPLRIYWRGPGGVPAEMDYGDVR
jgi:hypothetical protein